MWTFDGTTGEDENSLIKKYCKMINLYYTKIYTLFFSIFEILIEFVKILLINDQVRVCFFHHIEDDD